MKLKLSIFLGIFLAFSTLSSAARLYWVGPQAGDYNASQVSGLATVATSGNYGDLTNSPLLVNSATTSVSNSTSTSVYTYNGTGWSNIDSSLLNATVIIPVSNAAIVTVHGNWKTNNGAYYCFVGLGVDGNVALNTVDMTPETAGYLPFDIPFIYRGSGTHTFSLMGKTESGNTSGCNIYGGHYNTALSSTELNPAIDILVLPIH